MIQRKSGGSIINIVSIAGLRPQYQGLLYSFTKAGLIMMTKSWAQEFGVHNVRVNAIAPGLIKTDFSSFFHENPERVKAVERSQPLPRIGDVREISGAALYLASDESSFTTGEIMVIDGGAMIGRGGTI
jgi:NAD(P)-dependent dehydrogenase (short-subunit alcohol dehydrogenase family)